MINMDVEEFKLKFCLIYFLFLILVKDFWIWKFYVTHIPK
jgi:hypothetical protein